MYNIVPDSSSQRSLYYNSIVVSDIVEVTDPTNQISVSVIPQVSHVGCGYGFTLAAEADSCSLWTTGLNSLSQLGRQPSCSNWQGTSNIED